MYKLIILLMSLSLLFYLSTSKSTKPPQNHSPTSNLASKIEISEKKQKKSIILQKKTNDKSKVIKTTYSSTASTVQEKVLNLDFLDTSSSRTKILDHFTLELFNNEVFTAEKIDFQSVKKHLDIWRGASQPNSGYQNVVGVINQKTGYVMLSLNHKGTNYTIQPNSNNEYILRQIRPGNPD